MDFYTFEHKSYSIQVNNFMYMEKIFLAKFVFPITMHCKCGLAELLIATQSHYE